MAAVNEKTITCPDCGKKFTVRYKQTVRCKECAKKHKQEYNREWRRLNPHKKDAKSTERLWIEEMHTCDPKENIQKCLNCTLPDCKNCLSYGNQKYTQMKAERRAENA